MASRQQVKVHINRALRARAMEQKLDEIALAIGELARYVEDIEKDSQSRSPSKGSAPEALRAPGGWLQRSLTTFGS